MTEAKELAALADRLDISGADRTRWPAQERLRFAPLIAGSDETRRMMAEAAALDRLLDAAPTLAPTRLDGLIDRIVATAEAEGSRPAGNVVDFATARRAPAPPPRVAPFQRSNWQAAALLAASLFLGAFVGTSGVLGPDASQLSAEYDVAEADVADLFIDGTRGLLEDDTL